MGVSAQTTCADTLSQSETEISQTESTEKIIAIIVIAVMVIIIIAIIAEFLNEGVAKDWK